MPNYQWIISSCSNVCMLASPGLHWPWLHAAGWVQVCSMWISPYLEQLDTWGTYLRHIFTGKWPKQERAKLTASMFQASACITSANILLVAPKVKGPGPQRKALWGHRCRVCLQGSMESGALIYLTTAMAWSYLLHKNAHLGLDDQLPWIAQKWGGSWDTGLSVLKTEKGQGNELNCPEVNG